MGINRRDVMALSGGVAVGGLLSPIPWKLLDDSAIWTQNWPWTPTPARGVTVEKPVICTLCPAGCGMIARCVGANVFGVRPAAPNAAGGGALCAQTYGAHQQPYHPRRLRTGIVSGSAGPAAQAMEAAAAALAQARERKLTFAVLDERPGRLQSLAYAKFAAAAGGKFVSVPQVEDRTLDAVEKLTGVAHGSLTFDFENAGVILSLGAPLLDGWGSAGRMPRLWAAGAGEHRPWFVQVGSRWSRSAQLADTAYLIRPGSEAALVAALAGNFPLERASLLTGLTMEDIQKLTALLRDRGPAVVVGGGEPAQGGLSPATERMTAALNISLGAVGRSGGIVQRRAAPLEPPAGAPLDEIADGSLAVLVHDANSASAVVPDAMLRRKLAPGGVLIRFTAYTPEDHSAADILVPATTFLESADDSSGSRDARQASWSYSAAILIPPAEVVTPHAFLSALGAKLGVAVDKLEDARKAKEQAIVSSGRGQIYRFAGGAAVPVSNVEALRKEMDAGALWIDDPAPVRPIAVHAARVSWDVPEAASVPLLAVAAGNRGSMGSVPAPLLASKLDRETRLLPVAGEVRMHGITAQSLGLQDGDAVLVTTPAGESRGRLRLDAAVIPGLVELCASGPGRQTVLQVAGAGSPDAGGAIAAEVRRS